MMILSATSFAWSAVRASVESLLKRQHAKSREAAALAYLMASIDPSKTSKYVPIIANAIRSKQESDLVGVVRSLRVLFARTKSPDLIREIAVAQADGEEREATALEVKQLFAEFPAQTIAALSAPKGQAFLIDNLALAGSSSTKDGSDVRYALTAVSNEQHSASVHMISVLMLTSPKLQLIHEGPETPPAGTAWDDPESPLAKIRRTPRTDADYWLVVSFSRNSTGQIRAVLTPRAKMPSGFTFSVAEGY